MTFIASEPEDIIPGPIDSGEHVACMAPGCGGRAAVIWVDRFDPWTSVLCAEHGRKSLPSAAVIANPIFFDSCPPDVRQAAEVRAEPLWRAERLRDA
jgi:hypothetical protein